MNAHVELETPRSSTLRKPLLGCGALASLLYVGTDVTAAIAHPEYHSFTSRAISELMASGAPTERLVDPLFLIYDLLMIAFAVGVWTTGREKRVRLTAASLFAYGAFGLLGPTVFEMNVRGSGGDPTADYLHIAATMVLVLLIFASVGSGASLGGAWFGFYSFGTMLLMIVFGILTAQEAPSFDTTQPTPWFGAIERVNIGAFLLWVMVLAVSLWRAERPVDLGAPKRRHHDLRRVTLST